MRLLEPSLLAGARRSSCGGKLDPLDFGESGGRPLGRVGVDLGRPWPRCTMKPTTNRFQATTEIAHDEARPMDGEL